jgi:hypothetical protein
MDSTADDADENGSLDKFNFIVGGSMNAAMTVKTK